MLLHEQLDHAYEEATAGAEPSMNYLTMTVDIDAARNNLSGAEEVDLRAAVLQTKPRPVESKLRPD